MAYPFRTEAAFARNQWYIAAWSHEVSGTPLARTLCGDDVVLYRLSDGAAVAVAGVCPHRWMPLGGAAVIDDQIACPYHGARFDRSGRCVRAPADLRAPAGFALKAYALVERAPCIWIWTGDPQRADPGLIPDAASLGLGSSDWEVDLANPRRLAARPQLLIENLFDQSHVSAVHPQSLGVAVVTAHPDDMETIETPERLSEYRRLPPTPVDDGARAVFEGVGDYLSARLRVEMLGAALINSTGSQTFATDAHGENPRLVGEMNFLHAVTPETATSTHYFTAITRNFALGAPAFTAALAERNAAVVGEDIAILEAIEARIDAVGDPQKETTFATDAGAMHVRRRIARLIAQDAGDAPPTRHMD